MKIFQAILVKFAFLYFVVLGIILSPSYLGAYSSGNLAVPFFAKLLDYIADPNLLFLFFILGIVGLIWEITHPGLLIPGIFGGVFLVLVFFLSSVVTINFSAAFVIVVGILLMIAEVFAPGFGILGLSGLVCFVWGSFSLLDGVPGNQIHLSYSVIAFGGLFLVSSLFVIGYLISKSKTHVQLTGPEAMVGRETEVISDFSPDGRGKVLMDGEIWNAFFCDSLAMPKKGEFLVVKKCEGLLLELKKK